MVNSFTCMPKSKRMAVPAYRQKYSTAGRDVALPSMKAKKFVIEVSEMRGAHEEKIEGVDARATCIVSLDGW